MKKPKSFEEVVKEMSAGYSIHEAIIESILKEFLGLLASQGLLPPEEGWYIQGTGLSISVK